MYSSHVHWIINALCRVHHRQFPLLSWLKSLSLLTNRIQYRFGLLNDRKWRLLTSIAVYPMWLQLDQRWYVGQVESSHIYEPDWEPGFLCQHAERSVPWFTYVLQALVDSGSKSLKLQLKWTIPGNAFMHQLPFLFKISSWKLVK